MAHHRFLLAGIQRSNAGILLADTETSEGRMLAEIQDSLVNPDKPLMRAFIELCKAINAGGREKDRQAKAQSAYAEALEALRVVIREAAPVRIESSNDVSATGSSGGDGSDGEGGGGGGGGGDGSDGGDGGDDGDGSGGGDGGGAAGSSSPTRKRPADALDNEDSSR